MSKEISCICELGKVELIEKDNDGFVTDEQYEIMYKSLPIAVSSNEELDDVEFIFEWNWHDIVADLNKERYKFWAELVSLTKE